MANNFTPGPWTCGLDRCDCVIAPDGTHVVCMGHDYDEGGVFLSDQYVANARLIAAAPELLEVVRVLLHEVEPIQQSKNGDWACKECRPHSDILKEGFQCAYHKGLSLIAKVEGAK